MKIAINENNVGTYGSFLAQAYQYLETLEWHNAYQFLLKKGIKIDDGDQDEFHIDTEDKTFFSREAFKKYEFDTSKTPKVRIYDESVYIIFKEDRNDNKRAFTSIEQYFNYIEVIKNSGKAHHFLLSLPLDEGILTIDSNTRIITIPGNFVSTVMQKDAYAETLVFTVDRFFDNIDLAGENFEIYVQWSGYDENGDLRQEASYVELKELVDRKIKFGWILDNRITEYPGDVQFSVVFFKRNEADPNLLDFRMSTLPSTLTIHPVLQPELNSMSETVNAKTPLFNIIRNNKYSGAGIPEPQTPSFSTPGLDLLNNDPIEPDGGVLEFKAQAVVPDDGNIEYNWWYAPSNCEKAYNCAGGYHVYERGNVILKADYEKLTAESQKYFEPSKDEDGNIIVDKYEKPVSYIMKEEESKKAYYKSFGNIGKIYSLVNETDNNTQDIYFTAKDEDILEGTTTDDDNNIIKNYKKEWFVPVEDFGGLTDVFRQWTGSEEDANKPKYEMFTVFKTPTDKELDIVGRYYVTAVNTKPGRHSETGKQTEQRSNIQYSQGCDVKGPIEVEFNKEMQDIYYIRDVRVLKQEETLTEKDYLDLLNSLEFEEDKDKLRDEENIMKDDDGIYTVKKQIPNLRIKYVELKIDLKDSTGDLTYEWYSGDTEDSINEKIADAITDTYIADTPKWHQVVVKATKNRETNIAFSEPFRAVFMPRPYVLAIDRNKSSNFSEPYQGVYMLDTVEDNTKVTLAVSPSLPIDGVNKMGNSLYTDGIEYKWYKYIKNGSVDLVTTSDLAEGNSNSLNSPSIVVAASSTEYFYKCVAINSIGEKISEESNAIVFAVS